jgi:hypothetical protein
MPKFVVVEALADVAVRDSGGPIDAIHLTIAELPSDPVQFAHFAIGPFVLGLAYFARNSIETVVTHAFGGSLAFKEGARASIRALWRSWTDQDGAVVAGKARIADALRKGVSIPKDATAAVEAVNLTRTVKLSAEFALTPRIANTLHVLETDAQRRIRRFPAVLGCSTNTGRLEIVTLCVGTETGVPPTAAAAIHSRTIDIVPSFGLIGREKNRRPIRKCAVRVFRPGCGEIWLAATEIIAFKNSAVLYRHDVAIGIGTVHIHRAHISGAIKAIPVLDAAFTRRAIHIRCIRAFTFGRGTILVQHT